MPLNNSDRKQAELAFELRHLRLSLQAFRRKVLEHIDGFDQQLARLEPEERLPSVQARKDWTGFLDQPSPYMAAPAADCRQKAKTGRRRR